MKAIRGFLTFLSAFLLVLCSVQCEPTPFSSDNYSYSLGDNSTVPHSFNNKIHSLPPLSPGYHYEHEIVSHFTSRLDSCIRQAPSGDGLLFHIDDQIDYNSEDAKDKKDSVFVKRNMVLKAYRGWSNMPFEQRLQLFTTIAGAVTVPMYLVSAVSTSCIE